MKITNSISSSQTKALVLLAGLDSTAALFWARETYSEVRAVSFDYEQPHRIEIDAAQKICQRIGITHDIPRIIIPNTSRLSARPGATNGISNANVPARNLLFLTHAAISAADIWPKQSVALVVGCNLDDAVAFPDCRPAFFDDARGALCGALRGLSWLSIKTPWIQMRKSQVVEWCLARLSALEAIRDSVSCYAGTRCGTCDACTLRARSFAEAGLVDQ